MKEVLQYLTTFFKVRLRKTRIGSRRLSLLSSPASADKTRRLRGRAASSLGATQSSGVPMQQKEFEALFDETVQTIRHLLVVKGGEYAGSNDRLANFKRGASLTGTTSLQTALIYASKHYDAIATYVRDDAAQESRPRSEPIEGRLDDLINYCILMKALIREAGAPKEPLVRTFTPGKPGEWLKFDPQDSRS